ncbi:MAG: hypothetical protein ACE5HF_08350 [Gemmatimonadota bacterium]
MSVVRFETLPDDARLWCFGADRTLTEAEVGRLREDLRALLETWAAHGTDLTAGFDIREDRFLLVAVDESRAGASGCSIDGLVRRLKTLEVELGVGLVDAQGVWYRGADGSVRSCSRTDFRGLADRGEVGGATRVFDLSLTRLGNARAGGFEARASDTWHAGLLQAVAEDPA